MIRAFFQQPTYLNMNIIYYPNLQVHIIGSPGIFQILVNGDLVEFEEFSKLDFNGFSVSKNSNESKHSIIFNSGVSMTFQRVEDILNMMLMIPPKFKGNSCIRFPQRFNSLQKKFFQEKNFETCMVF